MIFPRRKPNSVKKIESGFFHFWKTTGPQKSIGNIMYEKKKINLIIDFIIFLNKMLGSRCKVLSLNRTFCRTRLTFPFVYEIQARTIHWRSGDNPLQNIITSGAWTIHEIFLTKLVFYIPYLFIFGMIKWSTICCLAWAAVNLVSHWFSPCSYQKCDSKKKMQLKRCKVVLRVRHRAPSGIPE